MANQTSNLEQQARLVATLCGASAKPSWLSLSSQLKLPLRVNSRRKRTLRAGSAPRGEAEAIDRKPVIGVRRSAFRPFPDLAHRAALGRPYGATGRWRAPPSPGDRPGFMGTPGDLWGHLGFMGTPDLNYWRDRTPAAFRRPKTVTAAPKNARIKSGVPIIPIIAGSFTHHLNRICPAGSVASASSTSSCILAT